MIRVGMGYRHDLSDWLTRHPDAVDCLEITAEHFFDHGRDRLKKLAGRYPLYVHGLGLSLGTPGPLDGPTLEQFARVANDANAQWVSEHIAFTRSAEIDLGHLNPVPRTHDMLEVLVEHTRQVGERCRRPVLLENITSHLDAGGELAETDFLNELCARANGRLLLDVTNLFINSRNHGFNASAWLREIAPDCITQLHVVGYSENGGRLHDHHSAPIQNDLMELVAEVLDYSPVQSIILERDDHLEAVDEIACELQRLKDLANHE